MHEYVLSESKTQTLITGVYRTGSEYLTQLLNSVEGISASMYAVNVLRFVDGRYDPIDEKGNYQSALLDISSRLKERYEINLEKDEILRYLESKEQVTYGLLYDAIMTSLYIDGQNKHWMEKCQLLWREIPRFLEQMPNGKAIQIVRDPRSVLASFKKYTYAEPPAYLGAIFNCFDSMKFAVKYETICAPGTYATVKYEELAQNPEAVVKSTLIKLGFRDQCLNQSTEDWVDAYGRKWRSNSSFHDPDTLKSFDVSQSINRWKDSLSESEVRLTEHVCGELMEQFGYEGKYSPGKLDADMRNLFHDDPQITRYYEAWRDRKVGIEEFPTDPTKKENWRKD